MIVIIKYKSSWNEQIPQLEDQVHELKRKLDEAKGPISFGTPTQSGVGTSGALDPQQIIQHNAQVVFRLQAKITSLE